MLATALSLLPILSSCSGIDSAARKQGALAAGISLADGPRVRPVAHAPLAEGMSATEALKRERGQLATCNARLEVWPRWYEAYRKQIEGSQ